MAIDTTGSSTAGGLDINSLIQSAIAGGTMSDLFGSKDGGMGTGLLLGLMASRGGLFGNNGNLDGNNPNNSNIRAEVDAAVAAALANANQANNNAMLLLKDIQDSSQEVISTVNSAAQTNLVQQLQNQIANLQGQGNIVNEIHEAEQAITTAVTNDGDKTRTAIAALAANIPTSRELDLQRQLGVAQEEERFRRFSSVVDNGNISVTQNVNQNQAQQQQQQQIWNINNLLQDLLAQQKITQGIVNLGTMTGSAGSQTAANTRVNS